MVSKTRRVKFQLQHPQVFRFTTHGYNSYKAIGCWFPTDIKSCLRQENCTLVLILMVELWIYFLSAVVIVDCCGFFIVKFYACLYGLTLESVVDRFIQGCLTYLIISLSWQLVHSVSAGNIELLKYFLSKGIEVDSQSDSGTPLLWAAGHAQPDAVKILLEHQANVKFFIVVADFMMMIFS